ncbi:MAG: alpha/beta hydrolase [Ilumatobacter sp.]|nr:alpha/beta hydrolase [Ilumatobacter sp.]
MTDSAATTDTGTTSVRTVVLVHGAWHGAWCYAALQAELDRRGVPSLAVDLPGHGASLAPLTDLHGDARCVVDTLAVLGERGVESPVLVGHSYGGAVITQAAAWFPAVAHLVYLAAFALDDGESVMGALRAFPRHDVALSAAMRPLDDGTSVLDPAAAAAALYGTCPPEVIPASLARISPQPMATMLQAVEGSPRATIPSTYVLCTEDQAVHPEHQRIMAARCGRTVELVTDHSPFLSAIGPTADLLVELASV